MRYLFFECTYSKYSTYVTTTAQDQGQTSYVHTLEYYGRVCVLVDTAAIGHRHRSAKRIRLTRGSSTIHFRPLLLLNRHAISR